MAEILVVSGPPGAGKSTIAQLLAQQSAKAVHVHTDDFYAWIVSGSVEPWLREAHEQNTVVMEAIAGVAARFARGGYDVVVDGIVGPWFLAPWFEIGLPVSYVVLRPTAVETHERAAARTDHPLQDLSVVDLMHEAFADLGGFEDHVVDSTSLAAEETVAEIRRRLAGGALLLES